VRGAIVIGLVSVTAAGAAAAARLVAAWPDSTRCYDGPTADAVRRAWDECDQLVCFLATGATVRLVAPLLADKRSDPAVVCVDEAGRHAVALLGGHRDGTAAGCGANRLAEQVAGVLGASPVITTATDVTGVPGLDTLGLPVEGAVAAVSRALLDQEPVQVQVDVAWPLPALLGTAVQPDQSKPDQPRHRIVVTDRLLPADPHTVLLRPPSLVVGMGASRGVSADEVEQLIGAALVQAGLSVSSVGALATVHDKADEAGLVTLAHRLGLPLSTFPASRLAAVTVPNPSAAPLAAVGTSSVAEAAALVAAGADDLLVPKSKSAMATVAVARRAPRGRLTLVGLGPGARDLLAPRAIAELRSASVVIGLDQYLDQIRDLLRPGTQVLASGLGDEEARAQEAVTTARSGRSVALVGSGDAGVYAMASPALEFAGDDIDIVGIPGITANLAASALLGAPLGHDHAVVSLSDLHTPWEAIEARVRAAAVGDFVVTFYNPRSLNRRQQLPLALDILREHRPPSTPVGVVREATRADEQVLLTTLADLDVEVVDMRSVVIVGSTNTRAVAGRMVTPRGYRWMS